MNPPHNNAIRYVYCAQIIVVDIISVSVLSSYIKKLIEDHTATEETILLLKVSKDWQNYICCTS